MRPGRYALLGILVCTALPGAAQDADSTDVSAPSVASDAAPGIQSSAARNKILREREMQSAVQRAREMQALKNSIAAAPMQPIPYVPPQPAPAEQSAPPPRSSAPPPAASYNPPPAPSSPNSAEVQAALMQATNTAPDVELPSRGRSGGGFLGKLLTKKENQGGIPDAPQFQGSAPPPNYQPAGSPYESGAVEMAPPAPAPAPQAEDAPIFVKRDQGSRGKFGQTKREVEIDINGVDVILPSGSTVSILEERDGFARVRIPDGRIGMMDRSAIE